MNLKEQAGPLPVGAWIAVVVGGLGVGYLARRKTATANAATAAQPIDSAPITGFRPTIDTTPSSAVPTAQNYSTNDEWGRAAISALIGHGYDPAVATNAINSYLYPSSDHAPTAQESAAIGAALLYVGSPVSLPPTYIPTVGGTTAINHPLDWLLSSNDPNAIVGGTGGSSGIYTPGETASGGSVYDYIPSVPLAEKVLAAGQKLYYQPTPGVFVDSSTVNLNPGTTGTALYAKRG